MRTKTLGFASSGVALALVVVNACTFGADDYVPVFDDGTAGLGGKASGGSASGGKASGGAGGKSSGGSPSGGAASGGTGSGGTANGQCADGSYDHDDKPSTACKEWTECEPGQHVDDPGTPTSDRTCALCEDGKFSDEANAAECTPWTAACDTSYQDDTPGTKTKDVVCGGSIWQFGSDGGDSAFGIDTDAAGNVYITGATGGALPNQTGTGVYARKYNAKGAVQWTTFLGDSGVGKAIAADADGNVYVVGNALELMPAVGDDDENTYLGQVDGFISKIGPNGVAQWTRMFGTVDVDDGTGIDVDEAGNIYVSGHTMGALPGFTNAGSEDAFVIKYSPAGEVLWSRQIGSNVYDLAWSVAVDAGGSVFLAGHTNGAMGPELNWGGYDAFLWKYASDGNTFLQKQFGTSANESVFATCADDAGYVYVAGTTAGEFEGQEQKSSKDGFVRMFSASGVPLWTRQFDTGGGAILSASCSSPGSVFLVGETPGVLPGFTTRGNQDVFVIEYDSGGNQKWAEQFGTPEYDEAGGVSVAPGRNVYVSGWTPGQLPGETVVSADGSADAFVVRYQR